MRTNDYKIILKPPVRAASILLFAAVAAFGQQTELKADTARTKFMRDVKTLTDAINNGAMM